MKRILLKVWRILPSWLQRLASAILRPHHLVAVGAFILNDKGQLLLCRHTYRRLHPWGLPGGDLKYSEDPLDGLKRELLEETGLTGRKIRLLLAENFTDIHQVTLTYHCSDTSGAFSPNDEISALRYFDIDDLPDLYPEQTATIEKCLAILDSEKQVRT